jgi:hypothetical protein
MGGRWDSALMDSTVFAAGRGFFEKLILDSRGAYALPDRKEIPT